VALNATDAEPGQQRRRARRTAFWLMLLVFAIYAGFILMSVHKAHA
jgi:uncharacterized membrane protein YhaH (DUF805 family)